MPPMHELLLSVSGVFVNAGSMHSPMATDATKHR
jgi:hypothetical protein